MLTALSIANIVLIERLDLDFAAGLGVERMIRSRAPTRIWARTVGLVIGLAAGDTFGWLAGRREGRRDFKRKLHQRN